MATTKAKKVKLSMRAIRILRKVEKMILEEPKRYDQNATLEHYSERVVRELTAHGNDIDYIPRCRTIGCIGGWVNVVTGHPRSDNLDRAAKTLGLDSEQQSRLFSGISEELDYIPILPEWPAKYANAYNAAMTPLARARVAVRRIERFIKTGGQE